MIQKISAPISVQLVYDHRRHTVAPKKLLWDGREYLVTQVGLHHTFREGRTLFHIYSIVSNQLFFRVRLDTDTLFWTLEEIADGLSN